MLSIKWNKILNLLTIELFLFARAKSSFWGVGGHVSGTVSCPNCVGDFFLLHPNKYINKFRKQQSETDILSMHLGKC